MAKVTEENQLLAVRVLAFVASDDELCGAFLAQSGADVASLRERAQDPEFLGFVLEFLLQDDARVIGCAGALGVAPESLVALRRAFPGGDDVHWT